MEVSCAGFIPPTGFLFEYGQQVDRTTYVQLLAQLTSNQNGTLTSGLATVTGLNSTEQLAGGMPIEGANVPGGTTILSVTGPTTITMSAPASASSTNILTFFAYPNGDGSTTFNLPDGEGALSSAGIIWGAASAGVLNTMYTTNRPTALAQNLSAPINSGGSVTISQANLPNVSFPVTIPGGKGSHTHTCQRQRIPMGYILIRSISMVLRALAGGGARVIGCVCWRMLPLPLSIMQPPLFCQYTAIDERHSGLWRIEHAAFHRPA